MNKQEKSFWKNPWVITTGSTVIAYLIIKLIDIFFNTTILSDLVNFLVDILLWIYRLLTMQFSTNILILTIIFSGILGIAKIFKGLSQRENRDIKFKPKEESKKSIPKPNFLDYIEDKFKVLYYRWEWTKGFDGKYAVTNIIPLCPKCKCMIVYDRCPNCDSSYYGLQISEREIIALIYHKIDSDNI